MNPSKVYVGTAPDKNDVKDVVNLINEYRVLLNKVFGTSKIERALWEYGHENGKTDDVKLLVQGRMKR